MSTPPFLVVAAGTVLAVAAVDQAAKRLVGRHRRWRRRSGARLALRWSLHVERLLQRLLWPSTAGTAAVLFCILLGLGVVHTLLGEAAAGPLLALAASLGGATSNALDVHRHGGVVNCATWDRWLAFNLADVAIVAGVVVALSMGLCARIVGGAEQP